MNTSTPSHIADALAQVLGNGTSPKVKTRTRILGGTECAPVALAVGQPALPGNTPETAVTVIMGEDCVHFRTTPEQTRLGCAAVDRLLSETFGEGDHVGIVCSNILEAFEDDHLQTLDTVISVAPLGLWLALHTPHGPAIASGAYGNCVIEIVPPSDADSRCQVRLYVSERDGGEGGSVQ